MGSPNQMPGRCGPQPGIRGPLPDMRGLRGGPSRFGQPFDSSFGLQGPLNGPSGMGILPGRMPGPGGMVSKTGIKTTWLKCFLEQNNFIQIRELVRLAD